MVASVRPQEAAQPLRILHVFRAPIGGLFRHVVDLARLQSAAGHRVGIVCDSTTGGSRAEEALRDLLPCLALGATRVPMRRNPHPSDLSAMMSVRDVAERVRAGVLHGHGAKGGVYARLAPVRGDDGVPGPIRAYTPHGGSYNYRPGSLSHRGYMAAEGVLARRTDVFLFESEYVAARHRTFVGEPKCQMRIVHNGIGEAEFVPIAPAADRYDLVYIGELREAKGIPWLLDALAMLRNQGRALRLLMVGSGPDAESLQAYAARLGLAEAVTFEPPQPIRPVLARGRLMVVPSLAESLPYVVLEAAAAGQPLVATNVGGIPEIFGPSAFELVPPRDAGALSGAIAKIFDEPPEARDARCAALSDFVQARFSMTRMGADVLSGYAAAFAARSAAMPSSAVARATAPKSA
ncbi:glycosyltransferase family 4 protein [Methylobacterium gnaphalii]|uniref:Glycosyl transferase n=1 Tax=Methylobacterium gnaphalii TaxID=1010610 RepID=A0A512JF96_9HYPH|nr:glycosyltransferase family 4 protein [Methylobacterium gnaphalii]GEP08615.1 glycosyl transferase [Methylobacterium gnaphalii]GJD71232.1 D-inositol-3-phosphate glycosyltransferase [Methylobacterium gnaphalii]GLS50832.1 glycosyl transferase [Methylobacterium gnaphalii]